MNNGTFLRSFTATFFRLGMPFIFVAGVPVIISVGRDFSAILAYVIAVVGAATWLLYATANAPLVGVTSGGVSYNYSADEEELYARTNYFDFKRIFDIFVSFAMILLLAPILIGALVLILAVDGRPALVRHRRIGLNGKKYYMYKFRTMFLNGDIILREYLSKNPLARREWELSRHLRNDPRVTPLGRFLRRSSIDELPQLFNVIRGEMSLVGPRPISEAEVVYYGQNINSYVLVRPGLISLWQVSAKYNYDYEFGYLKRIQNDLDYIANVNIWRDFVIIWRTVLQLFKLTGT